ncbi:MAG: nucleotidyltransferase domain-containing protein [Deltaproteobacteria bacterium]
MGTEELLARVKRALLPLSAVHAAVLYGSRASEQARRESDIDIAVLLDAAPDSSQRKQVLWTLLGALGQELRSDRIDLVLLNEAPPKLAFHVLKHGLVAFVRDPVEFHRFQVRTYSRHADYQPVERWFRLATKRRAESAGRLG